MDLKAVTAYVAVSERTIREWINRPTNPLPAVQPDKKILVRRTLLDRWLESHQIEASGSVDIAAIVDEVCSSLSEAT
jgi:excisionase family DNA binding protein